MTSYYNNWLYKGFGIIWYFEDDEKRMGPFLFSPKGDKIYYIYNGSNYNSRDIIYEIDLETKTKRVFFDPAKFFNGRRNIGIGNYFFINSKTMVCKATKRVDKIFFIDIETGEVQFEVIDRTFSTGTQCLHKRNITYSHFSLYSDKEILIFNDDNTYENIDYTFPDEMQSMIDSSFCIRPGRNINELFFIYEPVEKQDEIKIIFYDMEEERITGESILSKSPVNKTSIIFKGAYLVVNFLPDEVDILMAGTSNGIWTYNPETEELYNLIWWEDWEDFYVEDVSWDSSKILIYAYNSLWLLDIDEFLKHYPHGEPLYSLVPQSRYQ